MNTNRRFLLLPLLLLAVMVTAQTQMKVLLLAGAEQQYAIAQIGKITFVENVMFLHGEDGILLGATPVDEVDKIVFADSEIDALSQQTSATLRVFPNPTQQILFVSGLTGNQIVRIYSLHGQLLQSANVMDGEAQIPVEGLQCGTYLLQVGAQVLKFIKE